MNTEVFHLIFMYTDMPAHPPVCTHACTPTCMHTHTCTNTQLHRVRCKVADEPQLLIFLNIYNLACLVVFVCKIHPNITVMVV